MVHGLSSSRQLSGPGIELESHAFIGRRILYYQGSPWAHLKDILILGQQEKQEGAGYAELMLMSQPHVGWGYWVSELARGSESRRLHRNGLAPLVLTSDAVNLMFHGFTN